MRLTSVARGGQHTNLPPQYCHFKIRRRILFRTWPIVDFPEFDSGPKPMHLDRSQHSIFNNRYSTLNGLIFADASILDS